MKEETFLEVILPTLILLVVFGGIVGFFIVVYKSAKEEQVKAKAEYSECKERTTDIEWCFKNFNPSLD